MEKGTLALVLVGLIILLIVVAALVKRYRSPKTGGAEGKFTHKLLPTGEPPHSHMAALDKAGDGEPTVNDAHAHSIMDFVVKKADGHTHELAPV